MNTKFSWKTLVGLILLTVSLVVGKIVNVPWVDTTAIIGIIIGAVTGVWDILKKDKIQGPKGWIFVIGLVAGVTFLATGGNDENTINLIVGAIIIIIDFIFGKLVLNKEKLLPEKVEEPKEENKVPEPAPKVEETKVENNVNTEVPKAKKTKKRKSTKKVTS